MRWLVVLVLLAGCSQSYLVSDDLGYPYNLPPVGSKLVLKKSVTIQPGTTRTFLQRGRLLSLGDFDRYRANCNFEVKNLAERIQRIEPDTFVVNKVQRDMGEVVYQNVTEPEFLRVDFDDRGSAIIFHGYHLWFSSERQPDVIRLTCRGAFGDSSRAEPPSINEIREALGDFAELVLAI